MNVKGMKSEWIRMNVVTFVISYVSSILLAILTFHSNSHSLGQIVAIESNLH